MPALLPADSPLNKSGKDITILDAKADFATIEPDYKTIRRTMQEKHAELGSKVDLWIHLGQWSTDAAFVSCERRAFRQDFDSSWNKHAPGKHYYSVPLTDGQSIDDLGPNPWLGVPMGLESQVPIDETVEGANAAIKEYSSSLDNLDKVPYPVRPHNEAGGHACGFAFYESMANCFVNGRDRHVIFVHVPGFYEQASYERARDSVLAIIGSALAVLDNGKVQPATKPYEDD